MKRIVGVLSTGLLAGAMLFGGSSFEAHAAENEVKPYQVVTPGLDGSHKTIGFDEKVDFENYLKENPAPRNYEIKPLAPIHSNFYFDVDLQGTSFSINASKPYAVTDFWGVNDTVSSILTHPYGDHTVIYENFYGQGHALAIVNNGYYINLHNVPMGDGTRTWNDEISSAIVKSK
ncbi:hypothetical protein BAMA_04325 [Bacillus manliponensis]|uniref:Uncharacterized protein n=1 Tax=Bacillus manliponensis TaxID=574376 RepID=A0A073K8X4_9BACI|nr:hypothetical protein [Bacillus manliponensis]KEK18738.1 hypothetical protein BAMA_04325 [Bacillus manliponensis]